MEPTSMESESILVRLMQVKAPKVGDVLLSFVFFHSLTQQLKQFPCQVLCAIVLLLHWSTHIPEIRPRFEFLDLFAGGAQASTTWFLSIIHGVLIISKLETPLMVNS